MDGNDVLAVISAVREARKRCLAQGRAVLVEAMSYRYVVITSHGRFPHSLAFSVGHHSTSDDSFAYRARSEVEDRKRIDNPIIRFRLFMESQGWWSAEEEDELKTRLKADVMKAFKRAESLKRCEISELFTDVYGGEQPWNIVSPDDLSPLLETNNVLTPLCRNPEGAEGSTHRLVGKVLENIYTMANRAGQVQK